jgi:hypothetical protein
MMASRSETHTRSPGESSVYSFSIVPDEPPAPAARVELGFVTVWPVARRLHCSTRILACNKHGDNPRVYIPNGTCTWRACNGRCCAGTRARRGCAVRVRLKSNIVHYYFVTFDETNAGDTNHFFKESVEVSWRFGEVLFAGGWLQAR